MEWVGSKKKRARPKKNRVATPETPMSKKMVFSWGSNGLVSETPSRHNDLDVSVTSRNNDLDVSVTSRNRDMTKSRFMRCRFEFLEWRRGRYEACAQAIKGGWSGQRKRRMS